MGNNESKGLTLTEKIIKNHIIDGEMIKGTEIGLRIDQTLTQDATGTMAYLEFEAMNAYSNRIRASWTTTRSSQALKMPMTTDT